MATARAHACAHLWLWAGRMQCHNCRAFCSIWALIGLEVALIGLVVALFSLRLPDSLFSGRHLARCYHLSGKTLTCELEHGMLCCVMQSQAGWTVLKFSCPVL